MCVAYRMSGTFGGDFNLVDLALTAKLKSLNTVVLSQVLINSNNL